MKLQRVQWQYAERQYVFHHSGQTGRGSGAHKQRRNLSWQPSQMRGPNSATSHHNWITDTRRRQKTSLPPPGTRNLPDTEDGVSAAVVHVSRPAGWSATYAPRDRREQNIQFFLHLKRFPHPSYQTTSSRAYGPAGTTRTSSPTCRPG
jgi:hypothetical protein